MVFKTNYRYNAGQKYCRMLQREHSAILSTFIKLPFVIEIFVLAIFEWLFYTGFTVLGMTDQAAPKFLSQTLVHIVYNTGYLST